MTKKFEKKGLSAVRKVSKKEVMMNERKFQEKLDESESNEIDLPKVVNAFAQNVLNEHKLDGILVIATKDGNIVPHVLTKSVPDLLSLQFILNREISRVIENILAPKI